MIDITKMTMKELLNHTDDWNDYKGKSLVADIIRFKEVEERYLSLKNQVENNVEYYMKLSPGERAEFSELNPTSLVFFVQDKENLSIDRIYNIADDIAEDKNKYLNWDEYTVTLISIITNDVVEYKFRMNI